MKKIKILKAMKRRLKERLEHLHDRKENADGYFEGMQDGYVESIYEIDELIAQLKRQKRAIE